MILHRIETPDGRGLFMHLHDHDHDAWRWAIKLPHMRTDGWGDLVGGGHPIQWLFAFASEAFLTSQWWRDTRVKIRRPEMLRYRLYAVHMCVGPDAPPFDQALFARRHACIVADMALPA